MKMLHWLLNAVLAVLLAVLLVRGGAGLGRAGEPSAPDADRMAARLERVAERLAGVSESGIEQKLSVLEKGAAWLDETLDRVESEAMRRPPANARQPDGRPPVEELLDDSIRRARETVARLSDRLELDAGRREQMLRIYAEHELRVLTGQVKAGEDFPVMFREMKNLLSREQIRIVMTEFAPDPDTSGDR